MRSPFEASKKGPNPPGANKAPHFDRQVILATLVIEDPAWVHLEVDKSGHIKLCRRRRTAIDYIPITDYIPFHLIPLRERHLAHSGGSG
jgi:hypothetical protein